jgi:hypothetical protein
MMSTPPALGRGRRRDRRPTTEVVPPGHGWDRLRAHAIERLEETIDEIPALLRRLKVVLLIGAVTMALFATAVVIVLARALH